LDQYTTPIGRPLVLAPVKWNIPDDAIYTWTVSGGAHTSASSATEYFTFNPTAQGMYTVTVSTIVNGLPVSASTKVQCCPPEGTYQSTARNWGNFSFGSAPGPFTGVGILPANREAASLGSFGGATVMLFTESVPNSGAYDLRIVGNAFGSWLEPGIIWVAQDANGNGKMDDTWYELKGGTEGVEIIKRYALTYYPDGSWQNNLGQTGTVPGGAAWWPINTPNVPITLTGTRLVEWSDPLKVTGYADTTTSNFRISDAIQADGNPVNLAYIDFVMVRTSEHKYTSGLGEKSTEVYSMGRYDPYDYTRRLIGVSDGSGGYTYKLVNNSGYTLTVPVALLNGPFTDYTLAPGSTQNLTLTGGGAFFDYSGGNVNFTISGNTATFTNG
jgi:hypothetical protein